MKEPPAANKMTEIYKPTLDGCVLKVFSAKKLGREREGFAVFFLREGVLNMRHEAATGKGSQAYGGDED